MKSSAIIISAFFVLCTAFAVAATAVQAEIRLLRDQNETPPLYAIRRWTSSGWDSILSTKCRVINKSKTKMRADKIVSINKTKTAMPSIDIEKRTESKWVEKKNLRKETKPTTFILWLSPNLLRAKFIVTLVRADEWMATTNEMSISGHFAYDKSKGMTSRMSDKNYLPCDSFHFSIESSNRSEEKRTKVTN